MLPARFLRSGEVLEVDIQDTGVKSDAGNKVLPVAVEKASKSLFAFPLPTKETRGVARKLLEVMLTFGLPLYVRSDPGSEFTAEVMHQLCKRLDVTIAYEPADHPRAQGTVERLGGLLHEELGLGLADGTRMYNRHSGSILQRRTCAYRGSQLPFVFSSVVMHARNLMLRTPRSIYGDFRGGMHSYVADKRQAYKEVRDVRVALLKRHEDRQKSHESRNAEVGRTSVGTRVVVGDKVPVKRRSL